MTSAPPRIVLTSGEPAGIGPDLCLEIAELTLECELIVVGDRRVFGARARQLGKSIPMTEYKPGQPATPKALNIAHVPMATGVVAGTLDVQNARSVLSMLDYAVDGCLRGEFAAMVTAPIQKSVINDAGIAFSGHTEYLAERTQAPLPVMLLVAAAKQQTTLRVALATTHLPLAKVPESINADMLTRTLEVIERDLRSHFGIPAPRILVCGLNPHAGESGHLGKEEISIIAPTLAKLRAKGMNVLGPAPADTAFTPRMLDQCDVVLAMYHDQGLPTLKYAGFGNAVNVTLGLPIIRTSVDHGTALELAGSGKADSGSLLAALKLAIELSKTRHETPDARLG